MKLYKLKSVGVVSVAVWERMADIIPLISDLLHAVIRKSEMCLNISGGLL